MTDAKQEALSIGLYKTQQWLMIGFHRHGPSVRVKVTPRENKHDGKQLLFNDCVSFFRRGKSTRDVQDGLVILQGDTADAVLGCVSGNDKRESGVEWGQTGRSG
jgi:hypothetical protein